MSSKESKRRALTAYILVAMLESFKMMKEKTPVSMLLPSMLVWYNIMGSGSFNLLVSPTC